MTPVQHFRLSPSPRAVRHAGPPRSRLAFGTSDLGRLVDGTEWIAQFRTIDGYLLVTAASREGEEVVHFTWLDQTFGLRAVRRTGTRWGTWFVSGVQPLGPDQLHVQFGDGAARRLLLRRGRWRRWSLSWSSAV